MENLFEKVLVEEMESFLKKEGFKADTKVLEKIASQVLEEWDEYLDDVYKAKFPVQEGTDNLTEEEIKEWLTPLSYDFFKKEDDDEDNDLWVYFKNRDMSFYLSNGECYGSGGWL